MDEIKEILEDILVVKSISDNQFNRIIGLIHTEKTKSYLLGKKQGQKELIEELFDYIEDNEFYNNKTSKEFVINKIVDKFKDRLSDDTNKENEK